MLNPLVSVIIPTYKHEHYIKNCLESLMNQTYQNIEVIILNDGSPDKTDELLRAYELTLKKRFINYIYIYKDNEGISKTLNKGLKVSKGKYIVPFASDDVMYPKRIEKQVNYMESNSQYGMVYSDGYNVKSDDYLVTNKNYDEKMLFSNSMKFIEGDLFHFMLSNVFLMPTPTICIKKECYEKVGYYDENILFEDPDMFIRISKYFKIGFIKEPLVVHRLHGDNNGKKRSIIDPGIKSMIAKYEQSDLLNTTEKETLLLTLEKTIGNINFSSINDKIGNKKLVAWGTGGAYEKAKERYNLEVDFFVDTNLEKQGKILDGKMIFSPSKLLEISKDEYYIFVLSSYYREIYRELDDYGFSLMENYF